MGKYAGKMVVMIGFKAENLNEIAPVVDRLKKQYPEQEFNVMNSRFPQYDFILTCFAADRDKAHQIGMALVKKELPQHLGLMYWCKEINLLKYNVKTNEG